MTTPLKTLVLGLSLLGLLLADLSPQLPFGVGFVREAAAIIGRPLTPFSYAGVARRTTRRFVYAESAAVATTATAAAATTAAVATTEAVSAPPPPSGGGAVPIGTVVTTLPAGCVATPIDNVEYYNCGAGVYYRAAFQGNNLVYVSAQP